MVNASIHLYKDLLYTWLPYGYVDTCKILKKMDFLTDHILEPWCLDFEGVEDVKLIFKWFVA